MVQSTTISVRDAAGLLRGAVERRVELAVVDAVAVVNGWLGQRTNMFGVAVRRRQLVKDGVGALAVMGAALVVVIFASLFQ